MQDSTAEQQERLRPRMASMASHEACHAAIASLRRGSFRSQTLTCGTSTRSQFAPLFRLTCRLDSYTKRKVVGVGIEVRRLGNAERGRGAGRKSWILKNVYVHTGY